MSFLNRILSTFLGDKAQKDISKIQPIVLEINQIHKEFLNISNDDLRNKTLRLKDKIKEKTRDSQRQNPFKQRNLGIERDIVSCLYEIASNKKKKRRSNF